MDFVRISMIKCRRLVTRRPASRALFAGILFIATFAVYSLQSDVLPPEPSPQPKVELLSNTTQKQAINNETVNLQVSNSIQPETTYSKAMRYIDEQLEEGKKSREGSALPWGLGNPRRLLLVTTWRSGSTFIGRILSNYTGVYNYYEPLMYYDTRQIYTESEKKEVQQLLHNLLNCTYKDDAFMKPLASSPRGQSEHNPLVWKACESVNDIQLCADEKFLTESCNKFPVIAMKTVRVRLSMAEEFLTDPKMSDVRIIYLVRDPRAVVNSRQKLDWCLTSPDCYDPSHLCSFTRMDLKVYKRLSIKYPDKITLVKYETLAQDPMRTFERIFSFAGLEFSERMRELVKSHTSQKDDNVFSTVRKSSERISLWQTQLSKYNITYIQEICGDVLDELGYAISN